MIVRSVCIAQMNYGSATDVAEPLFLVETGVW
jgi:hypothetical protein